LYACISFYNHARQRQQFVIISRSPTIAGDVHISIYRRGLTFLGAIELSETVFNKLDFDFSPITTQTRRPLSNLDTLNDDAITIIGATGVVVTRAMPSGPIRCLVDPRLLRVDAFSAGVAR